MSDERRGGDSNDRDQPAQTASALNAADRLRHTITEDRAQRLDASSQRAAEPPHAPHLPERGAGSVASVAVEALHHPDQRDGQGAPRELRALQQRVNPRLDRFTDVQPLTRQGVLQAVREMRRSAPASAEVRVVLGDKVHSRLQPDTRSRVTRRLARGTVVRAVERRKSWTLVECDAGGGAGVVQGWVYNKYLQPVAAKRR